MTDRYDDPWQVLGLDEDAAPDVLRARYVELVKAHPPDRDPAVFERLRDAYQEVSDPNWRARRRMLGPEPLADELELIRLLCRHGRRPVGAAAWLRVLEKGQR